jgi:hypothetical protein
MENQDEVKLEIIFWGGGENYYKLYTNASDI